MSSYLNVLCINIKGEGNETKKVRSTTDHSRVPFLSAVIISPRISLLNGQHARKAFMFDNRPKHLWIMNKKNIHFESSQYLLILDKRLIILIIYYNEDSKNFVLFYFKFFLTNTSEQLNIIILTYWQENSSHYWYRVQYQYQKSFKLLFLPPLLLLVWKKNKLLEFVYHFSFRRLKISHFEN